MPAGGAVAVTGALATAGSFVAGGGGSAFATVVGTAVTDEAATGFAVTGAGERAKVLRRFYRHDGRGQGQGLGLSIVSALVSLHGGAVFLEDADPGLRVRIIFSNDAATLPNGNVLMTPKTSIR